MDNINFNKLINLTNETIVKIFDLIKNRDWISLIKLIKITKID